MNVMDFKKDVNILLKNKHFRNHCYAWECLSNSFEHVAGLIDKKIRIYKPLGLSLLVLIPILSAVISALVGIPPESLSKRLPISGQELLFCLSLILTILTILNSLFKPSQRFNQACLLGIEIDRFGIGFIAELEMMPEPISEPDLVKLVSDKRAELQKIQVALIELALPIEAAPERAIGGTPTRVPGPHPAAQQPTA